jgi:hypothetical protein
MDNFGLNLDNDCGFVQSQFNGQDLYLVVGLESDELGIFYQIKKGGHSTKQVFLIHHKPRRNGIASLPNGMEISNEKKKAKRCFFKQKVKV